MRATPALAVSIMTVPATAANPPPTPSFRMRQCLLALARQGVIACPTEAVWGLSCDPWSERAVRRVLDLKQRAADKGLILVAADEAQLEFLIGDLAEALRHKMRLSWPGPSTWLVPHQGRVPPLVHGRFSSVAIRVSAHPLVRRLCRHFGSPLVSTSANRAGAPPPKNLLALRRYFGAAPDALLPGRLGGLERPSTIRDVFTDAVLRA